MDNPDGEAQAADHEGLARNLFKNLFRDNNRLKI
jgi:hypothetical protein